MNNQRVYFEKLSSKRTEALFVALTLLFALLFAWQARTALSSLCSLVFLTGFVAFLFYTLNYRVLVIRLDEENLRLKFGIFTWTVPLDNIESCAPDMTSLWRIGGAGIHFTSLGGRYRAMFNFLEHPRVVLALKTPKGPVRDIAFSTRNPGEVKRLIAQSPKFQSIVEIAEGKSPA